MNNQLKSGLRKSDKKENLKLLKTKIMKTETRNENLVNNSNQTQRNLNDLKIELQNLENDRFEKTEELFKSSELYKLIEKEGLKCDIERDEYMKIFLDSPMVFIIKDKFTLLHLKSETEDYCSESGNLILEEEPGNHYNYNRYLNPLGNPYLKKHFRCNDGDNEGFLGKEIKSYGGNGELFSNNEFNLPNCNISLKKNIELLKFLYEWDTDRKEKLKVKFLKLYKEFITDYFRPLKELRDEIIELEKIKISNYKTDKENQIQKWLGNVDKVEIKGEPNIEEFYNDDYDVIRVQKLLEMKRFSTKFRGSNEKGHKERFIRNMGNILKIDKNRSFVQIDDEMVIFTTKNLTELLSKIYDWNEKEYFKVMGKINKRLSKEFGVENPTDLDFDEVIQLNKNDLISTSNS